MQPQSETVATVDPLSLIVFRQDEHSHVEHLTWLDSSHLASSCWNSLQIRNVLLSHADLQTSSSSSQGGGLRLSPDGTRLTAALNLCDIHVFDARSGGYLYSCVNRVDSTYSIVWSPDSKYIASGRSGGVVRIYDAETGREIISYRQHHGAIRAVSWSPDGTLIASGDGLPSEVENSRRFSKWGTGKDQSGKGSGMWTVQHSSTSRVQVWKALSGEPLLTYAAHRDAITGVAFAPDGERCASTSEDTTMHLWNARTGEPIMAYDTPSHRTWTLSWHPDGTRIAAACGEGDDASVVLWGATGETTLRYLGSYDGHVQRITSLAWSPDGARIASAGEDGLVHIWQPAFPPETQDASVLAEPESDAGPTIALGEGDIPREDRLPPDMRLRYLERVIDGYEFVVLHSNEDDPSADADRDRALSSTGRARSALNSLIADLPARVRGRLTLPQSGTRHH